MVININIPRAPPPMHKQTISLKHTMHQSTTVMIVMHMRKRRKSYASLDDGFGVMLTAMTLMMKMIEDEDGEEGNLKGEVAS